ncbi:MAG TPA: methyltransferase domain-containing protein [Thermoanaerobaculia bacterium]|nr:methyltransferase domain-containing protein [Thermoanaerobaculia bacterium]
MSHCGPHGAEEKSPLVTLICPVRHCGAPLERRQRSLVCPQGHSFDLARSGYCNLLQPQDRRSKNPGDSRPAVEARRRLLEAGYGAALLAALEEEIAALRPGAAVLDVGCGEGFYLGSLAAKGGFEAHGLDLSVPAVELAARRYPECRWIVANADRFLPYAPASFDLALSLDARLSPAEIRRVLAPEGRLLVAVPAPDDLVELREAVLGEGVLRDRLARAAELLAPDFVLENRRTVRQTALLDSAALGDALIATYRGARQSRQARLDVIADLEVTLAHDLARFLPRSG